MPRFRLRASRYGETSPEPWRRRAAPAGAPVARLVRVRRIVALLVLVSGGCGDSPAPAPTPTLSLACPARIETSSIDGRPVAVPIAVPPATGGTAPVSVNCNHPGQFPIGSTTVGCTATDARQRTASCSFVVAVTGPPRLRHTTFLAFGDSLTAGTWSDPVTLRLVIASHAYPALLQNRLASRYNVQTPVVWNEGRGAEFTTEGLVRLRPLLMQYRPEVLLLMEGTNDLLDRPEIGRGADTAIANLRQMIAMAKSLNVQVALATVPPQRPNGVRNRGLVAALIPSFNDRIRALAAAEGVVLVDVYAGMKDNLSLIGVDDLHPTLLGFNVMADIYYEAVTRAFEDRGTSAASIVR
jgi:lysophospholipase L1-like esterase